MMAERVKQKEVESHIMTVNKIGAWNILMKECWRSHPTLAGIIIPFDVKLFPVDILAW